MPLDRLILSVRCNIPDSNDFHDLTTHWLCYFATVTCTVGCTCWSKIYK